MKDLLIQENFSDGSVTLHLTQHLVEGSEADDYSNLDEESFATFACDRSNLSDFGLSFLFENLKDLLINSDFISILYKVIAKIVKTQTKQTMPVPEVPGPNENGEEPSEDDKNAAMKQIEEAMKYNQEVQKFNEEVLKM